MFAYKQRHLVFQFFLSQALPRLCYNTRHLVLLPRLTEALPRVMVQRPQL